MDLIGILPLLSILLVTIDPSMECGDRDGEPHRSPVPWVFRIEVNKDTVYCLGFTIEPLQENGEYRILIPTRCDVQLNQDGHGRDAYGVIRYGSGKRLSISELIFKQVFGLPFSIIENYKIHPNHPSLHVAPLCLPEGYMVASPSTEGFTTALYCPNTDPSSSLVHAAGSDQPRCRLMELSAEVVPNGLCSGPHYKESIMFCLNITNQPIADLSFYGAPFYNLDTTRGYTALGMYAYTANQEQAYLAYYHLGTDWVIGGLKDTEGSVPPGLMVDASPRDEAGSSRHDPGKGGNGKRDQKTTEGRKKGWSLFGRRT